MLDDRGYDVEFEGATVLELQIGIDPRVERLVEVANQALQALKSGI